MSIAKLIYTVLLPQMLKKYADALLHRLQDRRRSHRLKKLKRQLCAPAVCRMRRNKLRTLLEKRPIIVAFQISQLAKWKSESVFLKMQQDPHFRPLIWAVPYANQHKTNPEIHHRETARIISYFKQRGIKVDSYITLDDFPQETRPDLIFLHEPYDIFFSCESFQGLTQELLCYVPYCFHNTNNTASFDSIGNNAAVLEFVENESYGSFIRRHSPHHGCNCVVTGTPLADIFMEKAALTETAWKDCGKPMKKVIWAPHWSITPGMSWLTCGTFLKNAEAMLELAEQYQDVIQFAFKPHPRLYNILCLLPEWGKERADSYYRQWKEMPNTQLEEGSYTALFMQSDAMIHDSGSFILEYLFADKPCMFLRENEGYGDYNEQTRDCLQAYQFGLTKAEIEDFLQRCVLGSEDPLREVRTTMRKRHLLPPHGNSAAQNIVDAILHI